MHQHQATVPGDSPPPGAPITSPSRQRTDARRQGLIIPLGLFMHPVGGGTYWIARSAAEAAPGPEEAPMAAPEHRPGQGLLGRLLGRMGAWFGVCEQTRPGTWRRVHVPRHDPWEPPACQARTIWSWWC